ncbi:LacI family DNA-binding transcriptional regulator [Thalassotalea ponticola]|uniref:LacI family DNA-binding transcriptional regulator n=1 Tax=Thalassotalea ponticola TaxID=1523392 RepID=UPI0025B39E3B|nr:LacI family DNA-binding transcriptional regulator [Thalassotalea ponticola]MDN3652490.1 LacI family DNA-binding transcriptional regulator [Thalassotalea ponticola]
MKSGYKATSFDIAYKAGVSQSTVSRALRNSPLVSEKTRQKIQAIAKELNYTVDKHASSLRSQTSRTIALLLFEDPTSDESQINPFFMTMLGSITRVSTERGYDLLVSFQRMDSDWHSDYKDSNKADGLILLGYGDYVDYRDKLVQLHQQGTHFVRWGAEVEGMNIATLGCDNMQGGYQVTQHLLADNRRHCAFIGTASHRAPEFFDRYKGHCKALQEAGIEVSASMQKDAISTEEAGFNATAQLLASNQPVDAIFAASDLIAIGALRAIRERGLRVPDDIAVAGFDDIAVAQFTRPSLTTAKQNTLLAGEMLVDNLIELINGRPPETILLPSELVVRESSRTPASSQK